MNEKILVVSVIAVMFMAAAVYAVPGVAHNFFGSVTINGAAAPDGTVVVAQIDGADVATIATVNGKYGYEGNVFNIPDPNNDRAGKTIWFVVNGVGTGKSAIFVNGGSTGVDLGITVAAPPAPSGGGGGGGGGYVPPSTQEEDPEEETTVTPVTQEEPVEEVCQEKWECSDWSWCTDGIHTRTCTDVNECGTDNNKPLDSYPCSTVQNEDGAGITGLITGNPTIIGGIGLLVVLIILYVIWNEMKNRKKKKGKRR